MSNTWFDESSVELVHPVIKITSGQFRLNPFAVHRSCGSFNGTTTFWSFTFRMKFMSVMFIFRWLLFDIASVPVEQIESTWIYYINWIELNIKMFDKLLAHVCHLSSYQRTSHIDSRLNLSIKQKWLFIVLIMHSHCEFHTSFKLPYRKSHESKGFSQTRIHPLLLKQQQMNKW